MLLWTIIVKLIWLEYSLVVLALLIRVSLVDALPWQVVLLVAAFVQLDCQAVS